MVMVFTLICGVQELLQEIIDRGREVREKDKKRLEEEQRILEEVYT